MLLYFFVLTLCFILDSKLKKHRQLYFFGSTIVVCFLCFGYMVGSDWRQYERDYENDFYEWYLLSGEIGSFLLFKVFKDLGIDFWIFTGLCKMIYLGSIFKLASYFTEKKWSVIGLYFLMGDLLAIIICCPFRNMLAITAANISIIQYLKEKKILAVAFLILACTFHSAFIVSVAVIISYFFLNKIAKNITSRQYILIYIMLYVIILFTPIFDFIYNTVIPFFNLTEMAENHGGENMKNFLTVGNIKELFLFSILVVHRKDILALKGGNILFYFAMFSSLGFLLFKCIPVGSRFNIINKFFYAIVFTQLISIKLHNCKFKLLPRFVLIVCFISSFYNIYNNYMYIPYSNSIPYILTKHLPYNERKEYNYKEYTNRTGRSIENDYE